MLADLPFWKQVILMLVAVLVIVGIFDALQNMPIVSNCAFYAECGIKGTGKIDAI